MDAPDQVPCDAKVLTAAYIGRGTTSLTRRGLPVRVIRVGNVLAGAIDGGYDRTRGSSLRVIASVCRIPPEWRRSVSRASRIDGG